LSRLFRKALSSLRLITVVALLLRLYSLQIYVEHNPKAALGAISFLFEPGNIAYSLVSGHGFASPFKVETGPTAWMTPVYPEILAGIFRVFGAYTFDAFLAAALLNDLFSTLVCVPLFFAAKRIGGTGLAAIAAWLWAIFPNAIVLPYEALWDASLAALLAACILWATIALRESRPIRDWCAYGLLWGFALMTSASLGAVLPFLLAWLGYRKGAGRPLLAAAVAILCCVPWTVRNYETFHSLVPLRSVMGLSLWLGNNNRADGISTADLHPLSNSAERTRYVERGEIAYNQEKQHEAIAFILAHPGLALRFTIRRFIAIWSGGTAHPFPDFIRNKSIWFRWTLALNVLAALGGAFGLALLYRKGSSYAVPVAVFPIIFPLAYYVTLAPPRYRHPIDPVLLLLTAVTIQAIAGRTAFARRGI
jgi:4-amino-4-deoxy-L-arabinose transferase-like glycosyltransferase